MGTPARQAQRPAPRLVVVPSAYREFYGPLLEALRRLANEHPDRAIAVMIPEIVERHWYNFFFRHRTTLLKGLLLMRGGPRIMTITTPWYTEEALCAREQFRRAAAQVSERALEVKKAA